MTSSIYISSEKIQVIGYAKSGKSVLIKDYATCPLPEGVMINGKITDNAILVECLADLRGKKPQLFTDSTLTVDGSSISSKRVLVPKLKKQHYYQLVQDEFAHAAEDAEELVYGYHLLSGFRGAPTSILACAAEKTQVESYISAFMEAGVKLKAIRIGVQAILNYVSMNPALQKTAFVLNVIDGVTMLSMIFDNGINVFMSRTRLYGENHDQFIQNAFESLSGFIQFNKSQRFNDISRSYYLGLNDEDIRFMNAINPYPGVEVSALDIFSSVKGNSKLPSDAHFAYLNTLLGSDGIDLIRSHKTLDKLKKRQQPKKFWIPALLGVIAALAVPAVYLSVQISNVSADMMEISEYLTDERVMAKSEELDEIMAETARYSGIVNQRDRKVKSEGGKALISNQVLDLITNTNGDKVSVVLFSFDENTGIVRVSGSSAAETDSAGYIDALKKSNLIEAINYTGYSYSSEGEYNFSIDVKLAAREAA